MTGIEVVPAGPRVSVLRPGRRLNMVSAPRLANTVADLISDGHSRIVVDLSDTEFVDSSGLGALISCLKRTRQVGGDLRLAAPGEQARMVLDLTNLSRVLQPSETVADAVAALQ